VKPDRARDVSGRGRQQPGQRKRGRALAAAGLADEGQRLALFQLKADTVDRPQRALRRSKDDVEILDGQQPATGRGLPGS